MVNISGLDKAKVLHALYHASRCMGMGFLQARNELTVEACRELVDPWYNGDKEILQDKLVGMIGQKDQVYKAHELLDELLQAETEDDVIKVWLKCAEAFKPKQLYFDYLYGRIMKVDLSRDYFDPRLYDRDNGPGAAERAIQRLKENKRL